MPSVVHSIHFPVSARSFVEPMVAHLNANGIESELWLENQPKHAAAVQQIRVPRRLVESDLSLDPFVFLRRLSAYRRQLREARPQVVHAHQMRASVIPLLAARLERVPVRVYHNHGLPYLGYRGPLRSLLRALEQLNIRQATHVLLVSHSNLTAARADGLLRNGVGKVLGSGSAVGVDLEEFAPAKFDAKAKKTARENFGIPSTPFVLTYVGRPVKRKGFHALLSAWERSGLGRSGSVLLVAGCGEEECAHALGHPVEGVKGLGYLPDLKTFYAASDAIVLPSDHEGFPYSLLEGAAAGRALIGTDIPGIRCAIRHNETGLLVPPRDNDALQRTIQIMSSDAPLRSRLGQSARALVEREFSREIVLGSLLDFYRTELLKGGSFGRAAP